MGTATLASEGNPSDGEMGQLLTREIKAAETGIFICPSTHSEGRRFIIDAMELHSSSILNRAALAGVRDRVRRTVWRRGDSSPIPPSHRVKKTRWKIYWVRLENLAVTPWSPPVGRGGKQKFSLLPWPN